MKLYVIRDKNNKIFAISEDKRELGIFFIQNNYHQKDEYTVSKIDNEDISNRIAIIHYELFINKFYNEYYIRFCDIKPISDLIYQASSNIITTVETLNEIINSDNIIKNRIIESMSKTANYLNKNIKELTDVYGIIKDYYNSESIMDNYRQYENYLNVFC